MRKLSAKDFREPLLLVLGGMTQFQAGVSVKHKSVYPHVFKRMNISDPDEWGRTGNNIPWVERWVQFAFKDLRNQGLGTSGGRGKWMLTPQGVQTAMEKQGSATDGGETPETESSDAQGKGKSVSIEKGSINREEIYHPDPYLRELASKATSCFGAYSEKAPTCKDCALRVECGNAMVATLSRMAADLQEKSTKQVPSVDDAREHSNKTNEDKVDTFTGRVDVVDSFDWIANAQVNVVNARSRTMCRHCKNFIERGHRAVWAHLPGSTAGRGAAMFHEHCYEQVTGRRAT